MPRRTWVPALAYFALLVGVVRFAFIWPSVSWPGYRLRLRTRRFLGSAGFRTSSSRSSSSLRISATSSFALFSRRVAVVVVCRDMCSVSER